MLSWNLCQLGGLTWDVAIILDTISLLFAATVSFISWAIFIFGATYMRHEINTNPRFWRLVIIFVMSIFIVIFIPRVLFIIVGWDGLGISRFLLIIHYQNKASLYGGYITIISNRVGDILLLLAVAVLSTYGHCMTWAWEPFQAPTTLDQQLFRPDYIILRCFCIAAYRKRAQVPFNAWLPEAIAAPTPVSALVHSSTLVTAGVYLLIRTFEFWSQWPLVIIRVWGTGMITIVAGGGKATIEGDVKKTIAYSTISQLGFIVTILGLGFPNIAFYHLITHALFKATIFMSVGTVFAYGHHYQTYDNWRSGWCIPLAGFGLCISLAAINIFPFLAGMYSKELIISTIYSQITLGPYIPVIYLSILTLLLASTFTIIYTVRIYRGLFYTKYAARAYYIAEKPISRPEIYSIDNNVHLRAPFGVLIIGTVTGGRVAIWVLINPVDMAITPWYLKAIATFAVLVGTIAAFIPCRGVTKFRPNPKVFPSRRKHKRLTPLGRTRRKLKHRIHKTLKGHLCVSAIWGDFGHEHDGLHWFIDRGLVPFYRINYMSSKFITLVERGLLETWTAVTPTYRSEKPSSIRQSHLYIIEAIVGIGTVILCLIAVLIYHY